MTVVTTRPEAPLRRGRRRPSRPSGDEREQAILATAERLLADRPFHAVSVDDLARGAGISRPTFYFYFAAKDDVLLTLLDRTVQAARRTRDEAFARIPEDPARRWAEAIRAFFVTWSRHWDLIRSASEAQAHSPAVAELWGQVLDGVVDETAAAIESERARGAAPAGAPARDLAVCLNRMNEQVFFTSLAGKSPAVSEDRVLEAVVPIWLAAIYGGRITAARPG
jgi:AcrR family transcriptional regulator